LGARKNLGTVLWFLDRKDESEREFQAVTTVQPADPVPHLYLGLADHARREFPRAKGHFEKAGSLALENPEVLPAVLEAYLASHESGNADSLAQEGDRTKTVTAKMVEQQATPTERRPAQAKEGSTPV